MHSAFLPLEQRKNPSELLGMLDRVETLGRLGLVS